MNAQILERKDFKIQTLLDVLPFEVYETIAHHLKLSKKDYQTALAFADGSELRRIAIVKALNSTLFLQDSQSESHIAELFALFRNNLRAISTTALTNEKRVSKIPILPHLRRASIIAREEHLRIVKGCPTLKDLILLLLPEPSWEELISTCASLPVFEYLQMYVHGTIEPPSLSQQRRLSQACPRVAHLQIQGHYNGFHGFWHMIALLPFLRSISLTGTVRPLHFHLLRSLRVVRLMSTTAIREASEIGQGVTSVIQLSGEATNIVERLRNCANLRNIHLALNDGAESGLWGKWKKLESMSLWWRGAAVPNIMEGTTYYVPDANLLSSLVNDLKRLRRICFHRAVIKIPDIERILRIINHALERLSLPLDRQGERIPWRLMNILRLLAEYCPNILKVVLTGVEWEIIASDEEIRNCFQAFGDVRRKCPKLELKSLCKFIYRLRCVPMKRSWEEAFGK